MRYFKTPLARRLFWVVFLSVNSLVFVVWPVSEMISMRAADIKAVSEARAAAPFEAIDTLVDHMEQATRRSWITLVANSIVGTILATALAVAVCRPIDGVQQKIRDLIHDLRGPISGILNKAQIAIDTKNCLMDALLSIKAKAESVLVTYDLNAEIVRNYAGIDRGEVSNVDLTEIVEDYEELFGDEAEAKGVEFVVSRPPDAVIIRAHEDKLRRLVANLVENAVKYTDKGKVSVALSVKKSKFTLTVADTGIGMSKDEQNLIYNEYYRTTRTSDRPGIGCGLAMVGSIVEFYKGSIDCVSTPGKGTTFTITLPLDLTPRKPILRSALSRCGSWFVNAATSVRSAAARLFRRDKAA